MRRRLTTALTATSLLVFTACGGDGTAVDGSGTTTGASSAPVDGFDPQAMLLAASSRAEELGTARIAMTMEMTVQGQTLRMVVNGAQDLATGRATMSMDMTDIFSQMGDALPDDFDGTVEMLMDGTTLYMRGGFVEMMGLSGWVSMDLDASTEELGFSMADLTGNTPQDFGAYLDMLQGASTDIEELGREDVRGVSTVHLRATFDQEAMFANLDAETSESVRAVMEQTGMPSSYPMDVWVDDDGLVRRISFELTDLTGAPEAGGLEAMSMSMEFYDFGAEVDVTPPAESTDLLELMGQSGA